MLTWSVLWDAKAPMGLDSGSEMSLCFLKQMGEIKVIQTQQ